MWVVSDGHPYGLCTISAACITALIGWATMAVSSRPPTLRPTTTPRHGSSPGAISRPPPRSSCGPASATSASGRRTPECRSHFCDETDTGMLYGRGVMEAHRRLWSAVLLQAYADLEDETFQSYWWNQACAFFFDGGEWVESRRNICDCLGMVPSDLIRPALRILNKRRLEHGLPPVLARPTTPRVPAPVARRAEVPVPPPRVPLPLLVAIPGPPPEPVRRSGGGHRRWRYNPFDPFRRLPSEERAAAAGS